MIAAAQQFDPYHVWLGIPPQEQPANPYRLLGLALFERDPDVIASAADRQMAHLRTFQSGPRSKFSQQLLNEVAAAKVCLLNPDKKAAYDATLRQKSGPALPRVRSPIETRSAASTNVFAAIQPGATPRHVPRKRSPPYTTLLVTAAVCLPIVVGVVIWARGRANKLQPPIATAAAEAPAKPTSKVPTPATPAAPASPPDTATLSDTAIKDILSLPADESRPTFTPPSSEPAVEPPAAPPVFVPSPRSPESNTPQQEAKTAIPSEAEQRRIAADLQSAYPVAKAKTPADKSRLAGDLLAAAEKATGNADERYVLLRTAMDAARDAGDVRLTLDAVRQLAAGFAIDRQTEEQQALIGVGATASQTESIRALVAASGPAIDRGIAAGQHESALELANAVLRACQKPNGKEFRKEAAQRRARVQEICEAERQVAQAKATLQTAPGDPAANLMLGQHYCVVLDDWQQALPHLAKGSDEALRTLAERETANPPTMAADRMKLADAWWESARAREDDERDALLLHAGTWYQKAHADTDSSLARLKIDKRLEELIVVRQRHSASSTRRVGASDRKSLWTDPAP